MMKCITQRLERVKGQTDGTDGRTHARTRLVTCDEDRSSRLSQSAFCTRLSTYLMNTRANKIRKFRTEFHGEVCRCTYFSFFGYTIFFSPSH